MENNLLPYDNSLIQSAECIEIKEFDKAIDLVTIAYEKEREEGRDSPELAISNARWVGMILEKKGDLQKALDLYCSLDMPKNTSEYGLNQLDIISIHYRMGRRDEATRILIRLIGEEIDDALGYGMFLLKMGAEVLISPSQHADFIHFAKKIESILDVKEFELDCSTDASLIEGIIHLWHLEQSSGLNFSELNMSLNELDDSNEREKLIKQFVEDETIGYYKNEAQKMLI